MARISNPLAIEQKKTKLQHLIVVLIDHHLKVQAGELTQMAVGVTEDNGGKSWTVIIANSAQPKDKRVDLKNTQTFPNNDHSLFLYLPVLRTEDGTNLKHALEASTSSNHLKNKEINRLKRKTGNSYHTRTGSVR
jgi:hypothetical protein